MTEFSRKYNLFVYRIMTVVTPITSQRVDHCMRSAQPGISTQDIANKISDTMFKPCHMTNLSPDLQRSFETASNNLSKDGFCHHLVLCQVGDVSTSENYESDTNVSPNKALELINKFMIKFNQRLYRGNIYQKPELGKYFYVFFEFL